MKFRLILLIIVICLLGLNGIEILPAGNKYRNYPILSQKRLNLTREYVKNHYGLDDVKIIGPYLIVIHYTAISTIQESLKLFKADELNSSRKDIIKGGLLNIGVHFVIDINGDIWSLLPLDIIGRHTIGFNHVSIGIELVAAEANKITEAQLNSCSELIVKLCGENNKIKYLIGHHEYMLKDLPHFSLFKEMDKSYKFTKKSDPGKLFMRNLRSNLKNTFNIVLQP